MNNLKKPSIKGAGQEQDSITVDPILSFKLRVEQVKNEITILDILTHYSNINVGHARTSRRQFNICCPLHDDRNPSFTVYKVTDTWNCHAGCGHGDQIGLAARLLNISYGQALKRVIKDFDLDRVADKSQDKLKKIRSLEFHYKLVSDKTKHAYQTLISLEAKCNEIITKKIKSPTDFERYGDVYHIKQHVEYLLDIILEPKVIEDIIFVIEEVRHGVVKWLY